MSSEKETKNKSFLEVFSSKNRKIIKRYSNAFFENLKSLRPKLNSTNSDTEEESSEIECSNSQCNLNFLGPEAQLKLAQLFEEAGLKHLSPEDGKGVLDPEVLRQLTSSVNCALEEAVAALTLTRIKSSNSQGVPSSDEQANLDVLHQRALESLEEGESLLSLACSSGYYELVQVLLAMNTNIEERGIKGDTTPLMEAASGGYNEIVKLLLEHGADPKAQSLSGNTALTYACIGGHLDAVKLLLKYGADLEQQNENGHTALMESATGGHVDIARVLVKDGKASINAHSNEFKESALTLACYKGNLEMVKFLLESGADHEHKTEEMHTALMEASMDGHFEVAKLLLDHGAQVNMPPDSFESPLTLAACGGHVELATLLIDRGAKLEEYNDEGYTPLMEAAREGHKEMVALLISRGADINAQTDETQETALTLSCYGGFLQVADLLVKAGADIEIGCNSPLMEASQEGHLDLVHYLLLAGANHQACNKLNNTALTYAAENGHTDIAALFIHYGSDIDHEGDGGRTPLIKAARNGHAAVVKLLIENGADPNKTTSNNEHTALSQAAYAGHIVIVELLLEFGADPTLKLKDSSTALIEASKNGHTDIVQLLLDFPKFLKQINAELSNHPKGGHLANLDGKSSIMQQLQPSSLLNEKQALKIQHQHLQHIQHLKQLQTHQQLQQQQLLLLKEKKLFATQQLQQLQLQQKHLLQRQQLRQVTDPSAVNGSPNNESLNQQQPTAPGPSITTQSNTSNIVAGLDGIIKNEQATSTSKLESNEGKLLPPKSSQNNTLVDENISITSIPKREDNQATLLNSCASECQHLNSAGDLKNLSKLLEVDSETCEKLNSMEPAALASYYAANMYPPNMMAPPGGVSIDSSFSVFPNSSLPYLGQQQQQPGMNNNNPLPQLLYHSQINGNTNATAFINCELPPAAAAVYYQHFLNNPDFENDENCLDNVMAVESKLLRATPSCIVPMPNNCKQDKNHMDTATALYNLKSLSATMGMALRIGDKIKHLKDLLKNNYSLAKLLGDMNDGSVETFQQEIKTTDKWAASINGAIRKIERYIVAAQVQHQRDVLAPDNSSTAITTTTEQINEVSSAVSQSNDAQKMLMPHEVQPLNKEPADEPSGDDKKKKKRLFLNAKIEDHENGDVVEKKIEKVLNTNTTAHFIEQQPTTTITTTASAVCNSKGGKDERRATKEDVINYKPVDLIVDPDEDVYLADTDEEDDDEEDEIDDDDDEEDDDNEDADEDVMVSFTPEQLESRLRSQQARFERLRHLQLQKQQQQLHQHQQQQQHQFATAAAVMAAAAATAQQHQTLHQQWQQQYQQQQLLLQGNNQSLCQITEADSSTHEASCCNNELSHDKPADGDSCKEGGDDITNLDLCEDEHQQHSFQLNLADSINVATAYYRDVTALTNIGFESPRYYEYMMNMMTASILGGTSPSNFSSLNLPGGEVSLQQPFPNNVFNDLLYDNPLLLSSESNLLIPTDDNTTTTTTTQFQQNIEAPSPYMFPYNFLTNNNQMVTDILSLDPDTLSKGLEAFMDFNDMDEIASNYDPHKYGPVAIIDEAEDEGEESILNVIDDDLSSPAINMVEEVKRIEEDLTNNDVRVPFQFSGQLPKTTTKTLNKANISVSSEYIENDSTAIDTIDDCDVSRENVDQISEVIVSNATSTNILNDPTYKEKSVVESKNRGHDKSNKVVPTSSCSTSRTTFIQPPPPPPPSFIHYYNNNGSVGNSLDMMAQHSSQSGNFMNNNNNNNVLYHQQQQYLLNQQQQQQHFLHNQAIAAAAAAAHMQHLQKHGKSSQSCRNASGQELEISLSSASSSQTEIDSSSSSSLARDFACKTIVLETAGGQEKIGEGKTKTDVLPTSKLSNLLSLHPPEESGPSAEVASSSCGVGSNTNFASNQSTASSISKMKNGKQVFSMSQQPIILNNNNQFYHQNMFVRNQGHPLYPVNYNNTQLLNQQFNQTLSHEYAALAANNVVNTTLFLNNIQQDLTLQPGAGGVINFSVASGSKHNHFTNFNQSGFDFNSLLLTAASAGIMDMNNYGSSFNGMIFSSNSTRGGAPPFSTRVTAIYTNASVNGKIMAGLGGMPSGSSGLVPPNNNFDYSSSVGYYKAGMLDTNQNIGNSQAVANALSQHYFFQQQQQYNLSGNPLSSPYNNYAPYTNIFNGRMPVCCGSNVAGNPLSAKDLENQMAHANASLLLNQSMNVMNRTNVTNNSCLTTNKKDALSMEHIVVRGGNNINCGSSKKYYPAIEVDAQTESNHDTALTLACAGGPAELVELLIKRGSSIEHRDKKGFTPLIIAATSGQPNIVQLLLNHGANIEAQSDRTKDTALSLACSSGRFEVVEVLLNNGAYIEHRNVSDYTPLSLAASGGHCNIIKLLLDHGAEINSRTGSKLGISPLMLAAMNGHLAAVKLLLDMGSDINAQIETNKNTALTLACFQGKHDVVLLFLEYKANIEHRAKTGLTPLMEAASGGFVQVGKVLIERGADVNAAPVPSSRDTALTIAADKGHFKFVEILVSNGAQIEVKNKKGASPLWLASNGGHLDVVQYLVGKGADIDTMDNRKVTCLMAAFRKGHIRTVRWLVKHVNQYPSDNECMRFIGTLADKDIIKRCHQCMEIIMWAKDRQAAEANKNATDLLEELDKEKTREENKKAAAARRREKKRQKKKTKTQNTDQDENYLDEDKPLADVVNDDISENRCDSENFNSLVNQQPSPKATDEILKVVEGKKKQRNRKLSINEMTKKEVDKLGDQNNDDDETKPEILPSVVILSDTKISRDQMEMTDKILALKIAAEEIAAMGGGSNTNRGKSDSNVDKHFLQNFENIMLDHVNMNNEKVSISSVSSINNNNGNCGNNNNLLRSSTSDNEQQWSKAIYHKSSRNRQKNQQTPINASDHFVISHNNSSNTLNNKSAQNSSSNKSSTTSIIKKGNNQHNILNGNDTIKVARLNNRRSSSSKNKIGKNLSAPSNQVSSITTTSSRDTEFNDGISFPPINFPSTKTNASSRTNQNHRHRQRLESESGTDYRNGLLASHEKSMNNYNTTTTSIDECGWNRKPLISYSSVASGSPNKSINPVQLVGQDDSKINYYTSRGSSTRSKDSFNLTSTATNGRDHPQTKLNNSTVGRTNNQQSQYHQSVDDSQIGTNRHHKFNSLLTSSSNYSKSTYPSRGGMSCRKAGSGMPIEAISQATNSSRYNNNNNSSMMETFSISSFDSSSPDFIEEEWREVVRKCKRVVVASNVVARVIGRGGQNINAIRDMSGAHIEIDKQRGAADRNITIRGSTESIKFAYQLIMALIDEPDRDAMDIIQSYESLKPSSKLPAILQKSNLLAAAPSFLKSGGTLSTRTTGINNNTSPDNRHNYLSYSDTTTLTLNSYLTNTALPCSSLLSVCTTTTTSTTTSTQQQQQQIIIGRHHPSDMSTLAKTNNSTPFEYEIEKTIITSTSSLYIASIAAASSSTTSSFEMSSSSFPRRNNYKSSFNEGDGEEECLTTNPTEMSSSNYTGAWGFFSIPKGYQSAEGDIQQECSYSNLPPSFMRTTKEDTTTRVDMVLSSTNQESRYYNDDLMLSNSNGFTFMTDGNFNINDDLIAVTEETTTVITSTNLNLTTPLTSTVSVRSEVPQTDIHASQKNVSMTPTTINSIPAAEYSPFNTFLSNVFRPATATGVWGRSITSSERIETSKSDYMNPLCGIIGNKGVTLAATNLMTSTSMIVPSETYNNNINRNNNSIPSPAASNYSTSRETSYYPHTHSLAFKAADFASVVAGGGSHGSTLAPTTSQSPNMARSNVSHIDQQPSSSSITDHITTSNINNSGSGGGGKFMYNFAQLSKNYLESLGPTRCEEVDQSKAPGYKRNLFAKTGSSATNQQATTTSSFTENKNITNTVSRDNLSYEDTSSMFKLFSNQAPSPPTKSASSNSDKESLLSKEYANVPSQNIHNLFSNLSATFSNGANAREGSLETNSTDGNAKKPAIDKPIVPIGNERSSMKDSSMIDGFKYTPWSFVDGNIPNDWRDISAFSSLFPPTSFDEKVMKKENTPLTTNTNVSVDDDFTNDHLHANLPTFFENYQNKCDIEAFKSMLVSSNGLTLTKNINSNLPFDASSYGNMFNSHGSFVPPIPLPNLLPPPFGMPPLLPSHSLFANNSTLSSSTSNNNISNNQLLSNLLGSAGGALNNLSPAELSELMMKLAALESKGFNLDPTSSHLSQSNKLRSATPQSFTDKNMPLTGILPLPLLPPPHPLFQHMPPPLPNLFPPYLPPLPPPPPPLAPPTLRNTSNTSPGQCSVLSGSSSFKNNNNNSLSRAKFIDNSPAATSTSTNFCNSTKFVGLGGSNSSHGIYPSSNTCNNNYNNNVPPFRYSSGGMVGPGGFVAPTSFNELLHSLSHAGGGGNGSQPSPAGYFDPTLMFPTPSSHAPPSALNGYLGGQTRGETPNLKLLEDANLMSATSLTDLINVAILAAAHNNNNNQEAGMLDNNLLNNNNNPGLPSSSLSSSSLASLFNGYINTTSSMITTSVTTFCTLNGNSVTNSRQNVSFQPQSAWTPNPPNNNTNYNNMPTNYENFAAALFGASNSNNGTQNYQIPSNLSDSNNPFFMDQFRQMALAALVGGTAASEFNDMTPKSSISNNSQFPLMNNASNLGLVDGSRGFMVQQDQIGSCSGPNYNNSFGPVGMMTQKTSSSSNNANNNNQHRASVGSNKNGSNNILNIGTGCDNKSVNWNTWNNVI